MSVSAQDILNIFGLEDKEFSEAVRSLPVADVNAISEGLISGPHFVEFVKKYKLVYGYETHFQSCIVAVLTILHNFRNHLPRSFEEQDIKAIRRHLVRANGYLHQLKQFKKAINPGVHELDIPMIVMEDYVQPTSDVVLTKSYPKTIRLFHESRPTEQYLLAAIAELDNVLHRSRDRVGTLRRREFRKSVVANQDFHFNKWLSGVRQNDNFPLHETKLDRLVIDVYSTDLMSYDPVLQGHIDDCKVHVKNEYDKKGIPSLAFLEALGALQELDPENIDAMLEQHEFQRKTLLQKGYSQHGKIVSENEIGKYIFTYKPEITGAPIRLRIITNIQNLVRKNLCKVPEVEKWYSEHTWNKGSELNFIAPQHYEEYLIQERSICNWLDETVKEIFRDMVQEYMFVDCPMSSVVTSVSQFEVCFETPFQKNRIDLVAYISKCVHGANRELIQYFNTLWLEYFPNIGTYSNLKWESESRRPMMYCDIPSLDPTLPIMQFKVYPKFRNDKGQIMIRQEFIPTRFSKLFSPEGSDIPLSAMVLSSPEYVREIVERIFQFEVKHTRINGDGYNSRFEKPEESDCSEYLRNLHKIAIFGNKASKYETHFNSLMDSGLVPSKLSKEHKSRIEALGIASKIKRGRYEVTKTFQAVMSMEPKER